MSHYNQPQAQVFLTHQYQGVSPNYPQQQPNTTIYMNNNPNCDIISYQQQFPQSQQEYQPQPYYAPSPAPNSNPLSRDQVVPGSHSTGHSDMPDPMEPPIIRYNVTPMKENPVVMMKNSHPVLEINEQPKSAFRFRYSCEGSSHGALLGAKSEKGRKSYPSVSVENYFGHVVVVASLVPPKSDEPHPFSLTGKGVQNGLFVSVIRDGTTQGVEVRLKDLSILHVKKQEVMTALQHKYAVEWFIKAHGIHAYIQSSDAHSKRNPTPGDDDHDESQKSYGAVLFKRLRPEDRKALKDRATKACDQQQPLTTVRLCFRGYLCDQQGQPMHEIGPTFSCPITDTKNCPSLKICKIDKCVGSVKGHDSVYLLCDKVSRDDIEVVFEEEKDGVIVWTGKGEFQPSEVHHQVAIVFTTPSYNGPSTSESIGCCIKLRKPTTAEESNAITFRYLPDEMTKGYIGNKRKRMSESPYIVNKSPGVQVNNYQQATFDPAFQQLITLPINDNYMSQTDHNNMTTNLIVSESDALYSSMPDLLNIQALGSEADNLDFNIFTMTEDYRQFTETDGARNDVTERDGPAAPTPAALEKKLPENSTNNTDTPETEQKPLANGRNPIHIAKDISKTAKRIMNRQYQTAQRYAVTGDVRTLLEPLLPYFYIHEHTQSDTLLHTALVSEQIAALKVMLNLLRVYRKHAPIVVNMSNCYRHTPLHIAVSLNYSEAVRDLLDAGADPFKFDVNGNTSFHLAASRGHTECLLYLINYVTDFNKDSKMSFDLCPDVFNFEGKAPIHLLSESENAFRCCDLLLQGGADLSIKEELEGNTLLHYAVINNKPSLCSYLLSKHAKYIDIDVTTHSGDTPLYLALINKRLDIASTLLASKASVDITNSDGLTVKELCEQTPALRDFLQECAIGKDEPVIAIENTDSGAK
ncbi:hypothetical protein LOD99_3283 [Oopsacas minuta]|uniref:RHD domain-containing protein n=1 Tax=Oopsacas minuta TaxID=111878 RepID=A0AAV7JZJ2_9METZ|nr:hypothetical protein LOD99_3283 [Oopsacas minuta]